VPIEFLTSYEPKVLRPRPTSSSPVWRPGSLRPVWSKSLDHTITLRGRSCTLGDVISDPAYFWRVFGTWRDRPIRFDPWQLDYLRDHSRFRAIEKAPQIGYSWLTALEAGWDAIVHLDASSAFVSVDQREASNKILYLKSAYAGLLDIVQDWVPLSKDSTEELWFGDDARPSQVMSIPNTSAMRGRPQNVYLDESEFYKDGGDEAKKIAMGRATRGYRVNMGSTVAGEGTALDKTMRESKQFSKSRLPYIVASNAESIETIRIAAEELDDETFDEEYGCKRGGAASDTFSAELLRYAQHDAGEITLDPEIDKIRDAEAWVASFVDEVKRRLDEMTGLVFAVDVGTSQHPTIVTPIRHDVDDVWRQQAIFEIRNRKLEDQELLLRALLDAYERAVMVLDVIGIGRQAGESLQFRYRNRFVPMQAGTRPDGMPSMEKHQLVIETKKGLESSKLQLVPDKQQFEQFRRSKLVGGIVEQPGTRSGRVHYDRFWAACYGWYVARLGPRRSIYNTRDLIVVGG
jgi:phage FluMu gp28-like protein